MLVKMEDKEEWVKKMKVEDKLDLFTSIKHPLSTQSWRYWSKPLEHLQEKHYLQLLSP